MSKIVTFGCSKNIFIYGDRCSVTPAWPYTPHSTIEKAKEHLKKRGVKKPDIITK